MTCDAATIVAAAVNLVSLSDDLLAGVQTARLDLNPSGPAVSPQSLEDDAAGFRKLSRKLHLSVDTYLLAVINGGSMVPATILASAIDFERVAEGKQFEECKAYLIANKAGGTMTSAGLANTAAAFMGFSPKDHWAAQTYSLAVIAGGSTVPQTLVTLAKDFQGISERHLKTMQLWLLCQWNNAATCVDVPADLIPVITAHYTAGIITSLDILLPKVCCEPDKVEIFDAAIDALRVTVNVPAAAAGAVNYQILGVDMTGAYPPIPAAGYYATQSCVGGFTSNASNVVLYSDGSDKAEAWGDAVETNGGARPSQTTIDAAAIFYDKLVVAGILAKFKTLNFFSPDNLTAARTPFIVGVGSNPWANSGFVAGDLTVNGLKSDGTKYLDTGVTPDTAFASDATGGISIYHLGPNAGTDVECGSTNATGGTCILMWCQFSGNTYWQCYSNAGGGTITYASPAFTGFVSMNRTSNTDTKIYDANSTSAFAQRASGAGNLGNRPNVGSMIAFGYNNNGAKTASSKKRISFLAIHDGLTSTQAQALYNAVQALRTALGGGYV